MLFYMKYKNRSANKNSAEKVSHLRHKGVLSGEKINKTFCLKIKNMVKYISFEMLLKGRIR